MTPEEAWSKHKPSVSRFIIFGCIAHVHVPNNKTTNLENKSLKCELFGVREELKTYRLYDPVSQKLFVSRDVKFKEENGWDWHKTHKKEVTIDLELSNDTCNEVECSKDEVYNDDSCESTQEHSFVDAEIRIRRPPRWMDDYESVEGFFSDDENMTYLALFAGGDPIHYTEAAKNSE